MGRLYLQLLAALGQNRVAVISQCFLKNHIREKGRHPRCAGDSTLCKVPSRAQHMATQSQEGDPVQLYQVSQDTKFNSGATPGLFYIIIATLKMGQSYCETANQEVEKDLNQFIVEQAPSEKPVNTTSCLVMWRHCWIAGGLCQEIAARTGTIKLCRTTQHQC